MAKKTVNKKVAAPAPADKKKKAAKKPKVSTQKRLHNLFEARPKKFLIGQDHPLKR